MQKSESVKDNETHKILWYFELKNDYLISGRRQELVQN